MIVRPWAPGDNERIVLQPAQQYLAEQFNMDIDLTEFANGGHVMTGEHQGEIMIIAGIIPEWENRALAWAWISKYAGRCYREIHRATIRFLDEAPFDRIEATADVGFPEGHRWLKMMGFEVEGYFRKYRPDGGDAVAYARIK